MTSLSFQRAAWLLIRLRLRRIVNWGVASRRGGTRSGTARKATMQRLTTVLVGLAMIGTFAILSDLAIGNVERALGRVEAPDREAVLVLAPAPGSVLVAGVADGVTLLASLALVAVLLAAVATREMSQPEWDLEWLITLPLPLPTLVAALIAERAAANLLGLIWFGGFLTVLAAKCGLGWLSLPAGLAAAAGLMAIVATLQVLIDTGLRLAVTPPQLRNMQAMTSLLAVLPTLLFMTAAVPRSPLIAGWAPFVPDWAAWLPTGLAVQALAAEDFATAVPLGLTLASEVAAVLAVGMAVLTRQLGRGVAAAGVREAVRRAPRRRPPAARTFLPAVARREALLLARDRNFLVQTMLLPVISVALQVVVSLGNTSFVALLQPTPLLATAVFYVVMLTSMPAGFRTLAQEGQALWLLYSVPRPLDTILLEKMAFWAAIAALYAVVIFALTFALGGWPTLDFIAAAITALIGAPIFTMIANAFGVLAADPLATDPRQQVRRSYLYLYMLIGSFYCTAVFDGGVWQRIGMIVLTALLALALWQKAKDRLDIILDPVVTPPARVSASDGMIAALIFFALQAGVAAIAVRSGASGVVALWLAFSIAGAATWAVTRLWLRRAAGLPAFTGAAWGAVLRSGAAFGALAALCGLLYLGAVWSFGLFADGGADALDRERFPLWVLSLGVIVAPLFEEYIFRGLIFGGLRRLLSPLNAALASAAIFAVVHPPVSVVPVFVLGLCTAFAYERTRVLAAPIVVHALYNAVILGVQWHAIG